MIKTPKIVVSDVLIVGGGISGLTLAYYLQKLGISSTILEKDSRSGGVLLSQKIASYEVDLGPQTFMMEPEIKKLISELGLEEKVSLPLPDSKKRFLALPNSTKKINEFPSSVKNLLFSGFFKVSEIYSIILESLKKFEPQDFQDESIGNIFSTRFGSRLTKRVLSAPFVGVWATSIDNLSARSVLPLAYQALKSGSSITKLFLSTAKKKNKLAKYKIASLKGGLEEFPKALESQLKNTIYYSQDVDSVQHIASGWQIINNDFIFQGKDLVVASTSRSASRILINSQLGKDNNNDIFGLTSSLLDHVDHSPIGLIHVSIPKSNISNNIQGFGFLVPADESRGLLGAIYTSSIFPEKAPEDRVFLTLFCGGSINPRMSNVQDKSVEREIIHQLKTILEISAPCSIISKSSWLDGIPIYSPHHYKLDEIRSRLSSLIPNLHFHTNLWDGVSIPARVKASMILACRINNR